MFNLPTTHEMAQVEFNAARERARLWTKIGKAKIKEFEELRPEMFTHNDYYIIERRRLWTLANEAHVSAREAIQDMNRFIEKMKAA
jgi:hypothetical protein